MNNTFNLAHNTTKGEVMKNKKKSRTTNKSQSKTQNKSNDAQDCK